MTFHIFSRAALATLAILAMNSSNVLVRAEGPPLDADPTAMCCTQNGGQELLATTADGIMQLCAYNGILDDSWFFLNQHCNPSPATPPDTTDAATLCCEEKGGIPGTVNGLHAPFGSCQVDGIFYEAWQFYKTKCSKRRPHKEADCCMAEGGTYSVANNSDGIFGICLTDNGLFEGKHFQSTYCPEIRYQVYANNNCSGGSTTKATIGLDWRQTRRVSLQLSRNECRFVGNTYHGESTSISTQIGRQSRRTRSFQPLHQRDFQKSCESIGNTNNQYCGIANTNLPDGVQACVINLCS